MVYDTIKRDPTGNIEPGNLAMPPDPEKPSPPAEHRRSSERHLCDRIHARFMALGGVDLELPPREPVREPPRFY
jgi:hypothetical protein